MLEQEQRYNHELLRFLKKENLLEGYLFEELPQREKRIQQYVQDHIEEILWIRILYQLKQPDMMLALEGMR